MPDQLLGRARSALREMMDALMASLDEDGLSQDEKVANVMALVTGMVREAAAVSVSTDKLAAALRRAAAELAEKP